MRYSSEEYEVGWICALSKEMAAAKVMLDEVHEPPQDRRQTDQNIYSFGSIRDHNIVIACLPAGVYGTTSAATVAAHMLASFPSIRFGLIVGIGGGVPTAKKDIRLGDVVVSKPTGTFGGVVQYDFGRAIAGGKFERTGLLNMPPTILLNAVAALDAEHLLEGSKIPDYLQKMSDRYSNMENPKMENPFSNPGAKADELYEAECEHVGNEEDCRSCHKTKLIKRDERKTDMPRIHYGTIASGNRVIKDAAERDRLRQEFDIICFEMEAAGLVNNFPCIVVRGICDYADSHKNKHWQGYAAATGAAYAKELLEVIPSAHVKTTPTAAKVMGASGQSQYLLISGANTIAAQDVSPVQFQALVTELNTLKTSSSKTALDINNFKRIRLALISHGRAVAELEYVAQSVDGANDQYPISAGPEAIRMSPTLEGTESDLMDGAKAKPSQRTG